MKGKVCVSDIENLISLIMEKTHCSTNTMHPGNTKIYRTIKENYLWSGIKRDITKFVSRYLVCQQVKTEWIL